MSGFVSFWPSVRAYANDKSIQDTARRTRKNIVEKLEDIMAYSIPQLEQKLQAATL